VFGVEPDPYIYFTMSLSTELISQKQVKESLNSIGLGIQLEDEHIRNRIHDSNKVLHRSGHIRKYI